MSVSNNRLGHSHDEYVTGLRFQSQERALANASVTVLGVDAAPLQILTITTAATVRLPLEAPIGKTFILHNIGGALTVTDNAGSPNTVGTTAAGTTIWATKMPNNTYRTWGESAVTA